MNSTIEVPYFVQRYCNGRFSEVVEYITDKKFDRLFRDGIQVSVLAKEEGLLKCRVRRPVKPLTVMHNSMLLMAAELEYRTYEVSYPISLQEARWLLVDSYPKTNCIAQPYSVLKLIKEKKGSFKLSLDETIKLSKQRKGVK